MVLKGAQLRQIIEALLAAYNDQVLLERALIFYADIEVSKNLASAALDVWVFNLVTKAKNGDWLDRLLLAVLEDQPQNAALQNALSPFIAPPPPPDQVSPVVYDPRKVCWLPNGDPFIDRHEVRDAFGKLVSGASQVLVIRGERQTGRSHIGRWIRAGGKALKYRIIGFDFKDYSDKGPYSWVRTLSSYLEFDFPAAFNDRANNPIAEGSKFVGELGDWFVRQFQKIEEPIYLQIDGFDAVTLTPETHDFVVYLQQQAPNIDNLRLVLLAYHTVPLDGAVVRDVAGFTRAQVLDFLISAAVGKITLSNEEAEGMVQRLYDNVDEGARTVANLSKTVKESLFEKGVLL